MNTHHNLINNTGTIAVRFFPFFGYTYNNSMTVGLCKEFSVPDYFAVTTGQKHQTLQILINSRHVFRRHAGRHYQPNNE